MTPREEELLTGMGNCYEACHEDYEGTLAMVAESRRRTVEDVRSTLRSIAERFGTDPTFVRLRRRLPDEFPL